MISITDFFRAYNDQDSTYIAGVYCIVYTCGLYLEFLQNFIGPFHRVFTLINLTATTAIYLLKKHEALLQPKITQLEWYA